MPTLLAGSDPAEVRKARGMLELRQEVVPAPDDRTRRVLIGKGGKTITAGAGSLLLLVQP